MQRAMLAAGATVAVAIIAVAIFLIFRPFSEGPVSSAVVNAEGADIGGPFTLETTDGREVTDKDIITGPTLVYFGYTYCPDVCPVDVQKMAETVDILDEKGIDVTPVFITVDPARDTPKDLGYYVHAMHPKMIGLTGTPEQIRAAADAYKVYYAKVEPEDPKAGYLMNHTSFTYFMLPDGIAAIFRRGFPAKEMAAEIERILKDRGLAG